MRFNTPAVFEDKMRMAANLDEIISAADNWTEEDPKHLRKDDIVGFNRANVRVRVGKTDYTAEIVTGVKPNTKEIFYNIVNLKPTKIKTSIVKRASTNRATDTTDSDGSLSINNITQERDNVNGNRAEESGTTKYSRPVRDEAQIWQELRNAQEEERKIKEERSSWEDNLFDTHHAIGLVTENGAELLLHIGIDTVKLNGEHFTAHVKVGQKVKKGDLLISFDMDAIKAKGYLCTTPMIVCNTDDYSAVKPLARGTVKAGQDILRVG